jgi:hypothetical protein
MNHPLHASRPRYRSAGLLVIGAFVFAGCATQQPVVYQTPSTNAAQQQRIASDTQACRDLATAAVGINARSADNAGRSAARTGAVGFAATAVGGLVSSSRDVWQRARAGAAAGATGALVKTVVEWNDPDKVFQEYVERCMDKRGHDVLGWR